MKATAVIQQPKQPVQLEQPAIVQASEWLTIETLLYVGVLIGALALRLINLDAAPLSTSEAGQALAAFNGTVAPAGSSPLLYSLNQILCGLFGSSVGDAGVRLGSALIGTALVLLPVLWRKHIGRVGALVASIALAISPTMVFASRSLDGAIVVAACALGALGFGLRYIDSRRSTYLVGFTISIGLALLSGAGIITLAIVISIGLGITYRWSGSTEVEQLRSTVQELRGQPQQWRRAVLWGGAVFGLVATVGLTHVAALGSVADLASAWLAAWRAVETTNAVRLFQILVVYEPLILLIGLAGLVMVILRTDGTSILLAVWGLGAMLILLLQPGRQPIDLVLVLTPLALLAGMLVERLAEALQRHGAWALEGTLWLIAAPLIGYLVLQASIAAARSSTEAGSISPLLSFFLTAGLLSLIIGGIFVLAIGIRAVLRAASAALLIVLALISLGNAWNATQVRAGDPHELLWGSDVTTRDVRDLLVGLEAASNRFTGNRNTLALSVELPQTDLALQWYLREFKRAQYAANPAAQAQLQAIITPLGVTPNAKPGEYVGAPFIIRSTWNAGALSDAALVRWWVYREADLPVPTETVVLWVKTTK